MTDLKPPSPALQIDFFLRLQELRNEILLEALLDTLKEADPKVLNEELAEQAPEEGLRVMKGFGLTAELAFATPHILRLKPQLIGYYRLLLGLSKKAFYHQGDFGPFHTMEKYGSLSERQEASLSGLCQALNGAAGELITSVESKLTQDNLRELTILTLGPQFRGAWLNRKGDKAVQEVFQAVLDAVEPANPKARDQLIRLVNAAGRRVVIHFAEDPDVQVYEELPRELRWIVSMEIKGGTDVSNLHNRLGEAEKSHAKSKRKGYTEFWTLIRFKGFDLKKAQVESPTTTHFFDIDKIVDPESEEGKMFRERLRAVVGI